MSNRRKLPETDKLASAVNYWLACGRSCSEIAGEWQVQWDSVAKALGRGGYKLEARRYVVYRKLNKENLST